MKSFEYRVQLSKKGNYGLAIKQSDEELVDQHEHTNTGFEYLSDLWWGVIVADNIGLAIELLIDRIPQLEPKNE